MVTFCSAGPWGMTYTCSILLCWFQTASWDREGVWPCGISGANKSPALHMGEPLSSFWSSHHASHLNKAVSKNLLTWLDHDTDRRVFHHKRNPAREWASPGTWWQTNSLWLLEKTQQRGLVKPWKSGPRLYFHLEVIMKLSKDTQVTCGGYWEDSDCWTAVAETLCVP